MATIVASLMATIGGDASGLNKALAGAKGSLQKTGKEMGTFGGSVKDTILKLGGLALGAGAAYKAVGSVVDFFKTSVTDTMDYAKAVEDVSRFTGASVRESSKLLQIADDLRIPIEALKMGMKSAVREGVIPTIDGLKALAKEYQALPTDLQKSQFALEKFGRAGMEMQKFLELTPEALEEMAQSAEDFGLVLNSQSIKAAHDFYLQLDQLNDQWAGIKMGVGQDAIPALSKLLTTLESLEKVGEKGGAKNLAKDWWELFLALSYGVKYTEDASRGLEELYNDSKDAGLMIGSTIGHFEDYALWGNKVFTASEDMSEGVGGLTADFLRMKAAAEDVNQTLGDMKFDMLMEGIAGFGESLVQQTAMLLIYKRTIGEINEATYQSGMAKLDELRAMERLNEGVLNHTITEGEWLQIMKDKVVTLDEVNDAVGYTTGNMTELEKATGITAEQWEAYGEKSLAAADVANGSLYETETLVGNIDKNWAGVKSSIDNVTSAAGIAAMAAEGVGAAIAAIPTHKTVTIDIIYNEHGRPVGVGGDGEYGERGGNVYKAAGGPVGMGQPYIVGENGPEWFVPNTSGRIVPNAGGGGGGMGGDTYIINNNSTGAAALTMAIIQQSHRARLSRSMGG